MSVYDTPAPGAFGAGGYANASLLANTAYKNALTRINAKRSGTLKQYGYLGDISPESGALSNIRVDPNNAYGGLQSMLRHQAQDFQQADFAAQERGLHGGLAHKENADLQYQHGGEAAQLGTGFTNAVTGYQDEQGQAAYDRNKALTDALLASTRSAVDTGDFNQGDYSGLDYTGYRQDPIPDIPGQPAAPTPKPHPSANALALAQRLVRRSPVSKAAEAAKNVAKKAGATQAQQALAARSAGLNAKYKLGRR